MRGRKDALFFLLFFLVPAIALAETQPSAPENSQGRSAILDFANGLYARKMYEPAASEYEKFIMANPASSEAASAYFRLADSYYFLKKYEQAISKFEFFVKNFPADKRISIAQFRMVTTYYFLKDYVKAQRLNVKLLHEATDPSIRGGALFYLSKVNEARGWNTRSVKILERLMEKYPQSEYATYAAFSLGEIYLKEGKNHEALRTFKNAAWKSQPLGIVYESQFKAAEIFFNMKDYTPAKLYYKKLIDALNIDRTRTYANPRLRYLFEMSLYGLFYCHYNSGQMEEALYLFEQQKETIDQSSFKGEILLLMGNAAMELKDYDLALSYFNRIVYDTAQSPEIHEKAIFRKAKALELKGNKEEAVAELQKIIESPSEEKSRATFEQASLYSEMKQYSEALKAYEATLKVPTSKDYVKQALYQLAVTQNKMQDRQAARGNFEKYIQSYPDDADAERAYLEIIQMDLDAHQYEEASKNASQFIARYPQSQFADIGYYKLGMATSGLKKYQESRDAFDKVVSNFRGSPLYAESIYGVAVSLEKLGLFTEAINYAQKFTGGYSKHPLYSEVYLRLGYLYMQTENFESASKLYKEILFNKPDVFIDSKIALWLVRYALDKGDYPAISDLLDKIVVRFPGENIEHAVYFFKGEVAMGLKKFDEALLNYQKAITLDSDGIYAAHSYLGSGIACVELKDYASAEKNFSQALLYDFEAEVAVRARYEIANLRLRTGDLLEASKAFMMVAILYNDKKYCPISLYHAGECFLRLNKPQEAAQAFEELKTRYPDSDWTKKIPKEPLS